MRGRRGSVLVAVLWCVALLSLVVIGALHSSTLGLRIGRNHADVVQARYLALAGVERAKALLYHDAADRRRGALNHSGSLFDAPAVFADTELGRGVFRVIRQNPNVPRAVVYGVGDEESRLNLNTVDGEVLGRLPGMRPEVVAGIMDWRDPDDQVTPSGAEVEYYASLPDPYLPRNGPLQTPFEVGQVRDMPREALLGEDANQNGLLDPEEDDGDLSYPPDNRDGFLNSGWMGWFTVYSSVANVSASGETRVNVQSADEASLTTIPGFTPEMAQAVVAWRNGRRLESLVDLLEVQAPGPASPGQAVPGGGVPSFPSPGAPGAVMNPGAVPGQSPMQSPGSTGVGPPLISQALLLEIADHLTVNDEREQRGAVNVNTASREVLACLPGFDRELAQAVVSYRESAGFLANIAWLLEVPGVARDHFRQAAPMLTTRSETFRILSEGVVTSSGARRRLEVCVRIGGSGIETLSYRENL